MADASAKIDGILYIVATPIGHREDLSQRALKVLQSVDFILAEDTRHSMQFLTGLGIRKPLLSFHAHNEFSKNEHIINQLRAGRSCALISDAGTPLISDPGFLLVKHARLNGLTVVPVPGPCALITALSAAGIPCDTFTFFGFLPAKQKARQEKLRAIYSLDHTLIFYESTHRLLACLEDIKLVFGDTCDMVLAKELTKTFEHFIIGHYHTIKTWLLEDKNHLKGEFVLMIPPRKMHRPVSENEALLTVLLTELPLKKSVEMAFKLTGASKNELYQLALSLKKTQ